MIGDVLVPHHLPSFLVGCDDMACIAGHRDHQIAPQRHTAVAVLAIELRVHFPDDLAGGARSHIDFVDHSPTVHHVHEPVLNEGRRLKAFAHRLATQWHREGEFKILDVGLVDCVER